MSMIFFEGPAGTGKTTSLMKELERQIIINPLGEGQKVIGLTYMHGSRKRLIEKLNGVTSLHKNFDVFTFDSFAWRLICRWRSLLYKTSMIKSIDELGLDYNKTCSLAAELLEKKEVKKWVSNTYPIVVIDEAQECKEGRLKIIQQLVDALLVLVAGDAYQDLNGTGESEAIKWLNSIAQPIKLTKNHRTNREELLLAAKAVYEKTSLQNVQRSGYFKVLPAFNKDVAASFMAKWLTWYKSNNAVILTPTRPENSPFVRNSTLRLSEKAFEDNGRTYGPFKVTWELDKDTLQRELVEKIGLNMQQHEIVDINSLNLEIQYPGIAELRNWLDRQRKIKGLTEFPVYKIEQKIEEIVQRIRAYRKIEHYQGIRAMTIHQAKNQEFDRVIILWPYEISNNEETQRRFLYNAITRAKLWAVVIIQDPRRSRLLNPPFLMNVETSG